MILADEEYEKQDSMKWEEKDIEAVANQIAQRIEDSEVATPTLMKRVTILRNY